MKPEEKARQDIDNLLTKAGWDIQDVQEWCAYETIQYYFNYFDCL